jgi:alkylation response protein AidB-like acyl-CoA dehydrogenase
VTITAVATGLSVAAYRQALREWISDHATALDRWRGVHQPTSVGQLREHAELMSLLFDAGWSRYGWPTAVGGLGGGELHRGTMYDELWAAGLPVPEPTFAVETMVPPVVHFAPALAAEFVPLYLSGREWWSQGFSEPEAGSDLAALRCRAVRDGPGPDADFVINGQKTWTSQVVGSARMALLCRTGTPESRHRGLSMLFVDLDSPGVTVRPIALASGREELGEVFFDDVRVPCSRLLGEVDGGWAVAMYLLQFERGMYAWLRQGFLLQRLEHLAATAAARGPAEARRLGHAVTTVMALRARSAHTLRQLASGETIGPGSSGDKILLATAEQLVHDLARELTWPAFELSDDAGSSQWRDDWWYSRAASIYGGSAEVQRGIVADHVLRLPKETGRG